jgi:hypothetical protein
MIIILMLSLGFVTDAQKTKLVDNMTISDDNTYTINLPTSPYNANWYDVNIHAVWRDVDDTISGQFIIKQSMASDTAAVNYGLSKDIDKADGAVLFELERVKCSQVYIFLDHGNISQGKLNIWYEIFKK